MELADGQHTRGRNAEEEAEWRRLVTSPHGLGELAQSDFTFQSPLCRSRLD